MVDTTHHELVPDHSLVDDEELEQVLTEYDIKKTDLPKIKRRDPGIRDLDADTGDVVRIERDSRTTTTAIVYRLVID